MNSLPRISVVGAGPAGFYAAQFLLKKLKRCEIDIYERLPVPFGLVRFGVAPDHPEVKNVENTFTKVAEHQNVRFLGNVCLGRDITVEELKKAYHIVILAYGAEKSRNLGIPGENLNNVISARRVVGWYNGVPWDKDLSIDLSMREVAIVGQGNVAIDVARILLTPIDDLKKTDITQHALEALSRSKVRTVYLIGRRGPLQAAFTIKELREMIKLKNCKTEWIADDFKDVSNVINSLPRPKKRISELMLRSATENLPGVCEKKFKPLFFRTPLEFIGKNQTVNKVKLGINILQGENEDIMNQKAVLTDLHETIDCGLAIISIGYKSTPIEESIEFDQNLGVLKNHYGKIRNGLYATGWVATGPSGVILNTMNNSFGVAELILKDIEKNPSLIQESKPGYDYAHSILSQRSIQVVSWRDWLKINEFEVNAGTKLGKPREKILDMEKMLDIASS
ncbi:NADPH:adrenodoxin oxidoreductase, mitochondrial [Coccinella septempunctata]|uniref:NADPH:adrenodoxin oxidoreductase, mitochondrial n=1 Tax=Coccinella septempunctata TaxID=41139 RepID=UPI001D09641F|nr:NADPH:adrenodoxin oxidoreductase, mitochondrial [Coccinella septempunctata]